VGGAHPTGEPPVSRKRKKRGKSGQSPIDPATAVLPTVWMLSVGITAVAELVSVVGAVLSSRNGDMQLAMMTAASMFSAAIGGLIVLALTFLVTRTLQPPPPKSIVATALVVGTLPWAVLAVQLLR
jgi:hypothetical protein